MEKVIKTYEEFHAIDEALKTDKMSTTDEATLASVGFEEGENNQWYYDTLYIHKKGKQYFVKDVGEKNDKGEWFDNLNDLLVARKFDEGVNEELSFEYGGINILNPFIDETGREEDVDPNKYYGANYKKSNLYKAITAMDQLVEKYNNWKENSPLDKNDDMHASLDEYVGKQVNIVAKLIK